MNEIDVSLLPALNAHELGKILNRWREPHRRWSGLRHLAELLVCIFRDAEVIGSLVGLILVPKLHLGTHLSTKLCFTLRPEAAKLRGQATLPSATW